MKRRLKGERPVALREGMMRGVKVDGQKGRMIKGGIL